MESHSIIVLRTVFTLICQKPTGRNALDSQVCFSNCTKLQARTGDKTLASLKLLLRDALKAMFNLKLVVNSHCPQPSVLHVSHSKKHSS